MMNKRVAVLPLLLLFLAGTASASGFRCGTKIVEEGMSTYELIEACGEPTRIEGNRWLYDLGPEEFLKIVFVEGGQVSYIKEEPNDG
ncbi:MAG: DUF2845 domain-containing protein [Gammaproteobacteria bacterium]